MSNYLCPCVYLRACGFHKGLTSIDHCTLFFNAQLRFNHVCVCRCAVGDVLAKAYAGNRMFFAGEATNDLPGATAHAALETGLRAARLVSSALKLVDAPAEVEVVTQSGDVCGDVNVSVECPHSCGKKAECAHKCEHKQQ